ncbi:hypothetical protein C8J57DRAFT_1094316, partial [Mycena rebaudengoi]
YCHQKPKHGNHPYCSKTCAAQIATLCNHCQKKPKYQNFDFCGKNCAALAAAALPTSNRSAAKNLPSSQPSSTPSSRPAVNADSGCSPGTSEYPPRRQLVAQHIPQVQTFLNAVTPAAPPATNAPAVVPPLPANTAQPKPRLNNPFLNLSKKAPLPNGIPAVPSSAAPPNATQPSEPLDCLIPGCGQPVHVDSSGFSSDYCSRKHREEAVSLGLASPCIMCLVLPQSETDYFCGRDCKEEAMNKSFEE